MIPNIIVVAWVGSQVVRERRPQLGRRPAFDHQRPANHVCRDRRTAYDANQRSGHRETTTQHLTSCLPAGVT